MEAASLTPLTRGRRTLASDERLVAATRAGDDQAFETLYHRYHRRIGAYVLGMVKDHQRAEDVTQEVFLSALRRIRATDRLIVFKPWLYEIAKNACIDQFRRTRRATEVSYDAEADDGTVTPLVSAGPEPDEAVASRRQLDDLCGAFGGLSESHHQILVLRELEGRSYQEIGERLQMTRPAVESTLFRARKRLTEEYDELVSGERCRKVQSIIATAGERRLGTRDRRTMARHVSHCQPCRRAAALAGLEEVCDQRRSVGSRIAALLPLPAFLRHSHSGGGDGRIAGWLHAASPMADNASGWAKAAALAATVAVAGVGAGAVATQHGGDGTPAQTSASLAGQAGAAAASTRPASLPGGPTAGAVASAVSVTPAAPSRATKRVATDRSTPRPRHAAVAPATTGAGSQGPTAGPSTQAAPASTDRSGSSADRTTASTTSATTTTSAGSTPARTAPTPPTTTGATAPAGDPVASAVDETVHGVTQTVDGAVQGVDQAVNGTVQTVTSTVTAATSGTPVGDTGAQVSTALDQTTQGVTGTVGQVAQTTHGVVSGVTSTLNGAATGLGNPSAGG